MSPLGAKRYWALWVVVLPLAGLALIRALGLEGDSRLAMLVPFTPFVTIGAFLLLGLCVALRNLGGRLRRRQAPLS